MSGVKRFTAGVRMARRLWMRSLVVVVVVTLSMARPGSGQTANSREATARTALPTVVSGYEGSLAAAIRERVKALRPKIDNLGNVYVTIGAGSPHKLIAVDVTQIVDLWAE